MNEHQRFLVGVLAGMCFLATTNLAAQRAQTREGFWIGFGVGQGNLRWECNGCSTQDHGGPTGFIRLGGTPSQKVLLGAEINGWSLDIGAAEITALTTTFSIYWYPSATGGLFLKGGLGGGVYERKTASTDAQSTGGAVQFGGGYDLRVGQKISITPMLTLWASGKADLKDGSTTLNTGFRHSGGTIQVGITFH